MSNYYNYDGTPLTLKEWAKKFETDERHIGDDFIDNIHISTVWLGLDHSFGMGEPLIFETMIFGGIYDQEQWRYSTQTQAEIGHILAIELVKDSLKIIDEEEILMLGKDTDK